MLLEDYRDLTGTYAKLVSIEMIEAVGWQYFPTYFRRCSELLEDDGLMFLQAITIDDRAYEVREGVEELHQHPHLPRRLPALAGGDPPLHRRRDRPDAPCGWTTSPSTTRETLRRWREAFVASAELADELGYDLRFRRMWELYLAYVEAGFRERRIGDVQMLLAKPEFRGAIPLAARGAAEHAVGDPVHQESRAPAR